MAENVRPPVAVRIVRPYDSEEAFLESEIDTIGKASVLLLGAHPRPTGVILRFEVTLESGGILLRGEGRVLGHKENAFRGQPGLSLRFTRLDPRSKALVDRATALREGRAAEASGASSVKPPASLPAEPLSSPSFTAEIALSTPAPALHGLSDAPAPMPVLTEVLAPQHPSEAPERPIADVPAAPPNADAARSSPNTTTSDVSTDAVGVNTPPSGATTEPGPSNLAPPRILAEANAEPLAPAPPLSDRHLETDAASESALARVLASASLPPTALPSSAPPISEARVMTTPTNRNELLARLRARATGLGPERVESILNGPLRGSNR